jgi:4-hydroxy-tetrahydrodipicolinate synthase
MHPELRGIIPPVLTPFDKHERFDPAAMAEIVDYLIGEGVHGLFVGGSAGEFFALRLDETKELIGTSVLAAGGRVPVVAGTGAITTRDAIELARSAEEAGADAIAVITPFFLRPSESELYTHYAAVATAVNIPILGYANPFRAGGITLSPRLMARLAADFENVVGIKESSGDMTVLLDHKRLCPPGSTIFCGRDTLIFDAVVNDCAGAVAGLANVAPDIAVAVFEHAQAGRLAEARLAQARLFPLREAYSLGTFPTVLKEMAAMIGLPVGPARRPSQPLDPAVRGQVREILESVIGPERLR